MTVYQGEKFKDYLKKGGISAQKAADIMDVSRQAIYKYFQTANLETATVNRIVDKFGVNEEEIWPNTPRLEAVPLSLHPVLEDDETGNAKFVYAADGTRGMKVKIVPAKAQAGYLLGYPDPEYYEDFEYEVIEVAKEHAGTYLGFEVRGDSMITTDPELMEQNVYPGWRVIGRDLNRSKWAYKLHTHNYDKWVIVHKSKGILIKQIIKHDVDNGIITIHSLNPDYQDEDFHLDDIEQIFSVVQTIAKNRK